MSKVREVPTHLGKVALAALGPINKRIDSSPVEFKISIINNMQVPVTIVKRSGFAHQYPPLFNMVSANLIIRVEYVYSYNAKKELQIFLSKVNEQSSKELKLLREAFATSLTTNQYGGGTLVLDYVLTLSEIRSYGGTLYHNELDCIISLNNASDVIPHPYSEEGIRRLTLDGNTNADIPTQGFIYNIKLIDNLGKYGVRYINLGGRVYRVDTFKDCLVQDGVYLITDNPVSSNVEPNETLITFCLFEEAEAMFGLYKTIEEAINLGDPENSRKIEIANLEREVLKAKHELQKAKAVQEAYVLDRDKEMKFVEFENTKRTEEINRIREESEHKIKMERDAAEHKLKNERDIAENKLKLERERAKDYYEDRSYRRKDESEGIKVLPAVIIGIAGIFLSLKAFSK